MTYGKNISPVGWYVVSYLLRFVELADPDKENPDKRFLAWENTVLVKARNLDEAYEKGAKIARAETKPYRGGDEGVPVQWRFEGVTTVLPIYEKLGDGAEIMWESHAPRKLKTLRQWVKKKRRLSNKIAWLQQNMIKIDTSPITYYSPLDERSFFEWAARIPCVASVESGFLHIRSKRLSQSDLRDLVALMFRYRMPMAELRQFCNPANEAWFKSKTAYWYKAVFGRA